jgi:hypothetical protein
MAGSRTYLLSLFSLAAAAFGGIAALNLAMDPFEQANGAWYRLRPTGYDDAMNLARDGGLSMRRSAIRRSTAPVLLLGTSRVVIGFDTDPDAVLNAGFKGAYLDQVLSLLVVAPKRAAPPSTYIIELPVVLEAAAEQAPFLRDDWITPFQRLLDARTTRTSALLLGKMALGQWRPGPMNFYSRPLDTPGKVRPDYARELEGFSTTVSGDPSRLADLIDNALPQVCGATKPGTRMVFFEPPIHPAYRADDRVKAAVRARVRLYGEAIARIVRRSPACRIELVDLSGTQSPIIREALNPLEWYDSDHFDDKVGREILARLLVEPAR